MKLHAGDLFWEETRKEANYQILDGNRETDVLIIGGGMSGAMIANELTGAGFEVSVADAAAPGLASSDGNTGIVQYCSDMSLHEMIAEWGEKHAVDFYKLSLEGMDLLGAMANRVGADVGYRAGHSLFLAAKKSGIKDVEQQCRTLNKHGFPAEVITADSLRSDFGLTAHAAMRTAQDANLNPYKMVQALHTDSMEHGAKAYKNARMTSYTKRAGGFLVRFGRLHIRANKLILAMGYARDAYPPIEDAAERNTTYSFVTEPIQGKLWGKGDMVWDDQDPYTHFRITEDKRIIAGGRDRSGARLGGEAKIRRETDALYAKVKAYFPDLSAAITHRWQSVFGESKDGLPFIGRDANDSDLFYAFGFGGNGTCYSAMAAKLITGFLSGKPHPLAYTAAYPRQTADGKKARQ